MLKLFQKEMFDLYKKLFFPSLPLIRFQNPGMALDILVSERFTKITAIWPGLATGHRGLARPAVEDDKAVL